MRERSRHLWVGLLEGRTGPALFGVPWAEPTHLTLSFAPDGTSMPGGGTSTLFQTLNKVAPTTVWEGEIPRAFQAWSSKADINIALHSDSVDPLGTSGAVEGAARFGDIRIAAGSMSDDGEPAFASPFSWTGTTYS